MKLPKFSVRKIFYNNKSLFILSILAAILLWFTVVSNIMPFVSKSFGGISVQIDKQAPNLTRTGLEPIGNIQTVGVEVYGPRYLIGRLSSDDFVITGRVNDITRAGIYELQLSAVLKDPDSQITIKKISPARVSVYFDRMIAKNIPITVDIADGKTADGYVTGTATANPASVTVVGPEQAVLGIKKAAAAVHIGNNASSDVTATSNIVLYNKSGQANMENLNIGATEAKVTVPILKAKTVQLELAFTGMPAGFSASNATYTLAPSQIVVAGRDSDIAAMSSTLTLGTLKVTDLDLKTTKIFPVNLPDGILSVKNIHSATAAITLQNTACKVLSTSNFATANLSSRYGINILSASVGGIQLYGPASDIPSVTAPLATLNLAGLSYTGPQNVPVTISVPGKSGFWVRGTYQARVYVYPRW